MRAENKDALRLAELLAASMTCGPDERQGACHIRRLVAENEALRAATPAQPTEVERDAAAFALLTNPRRWTRSMHDAWHQNIPDMQKAFEALARAALSTEGGWNG